MANIPRYLARHPKLAHMVFKHGARIKDWLIGGLQSLRYFFKRRRAIRELRMMRKQFKSGSQLQAWYREKNFKWKQDPWGGRLDYSRLPWVSVVLSYGDCDDFMRIAEYVLRPNYNDGWRAYIEGPDDNWHAVYILRRGTAFYLASNQDFDGPFGNRDAAAHNFYLDKTKHVFYD